MRSLPDFRLSWKWPRRRLAADEREAQESEGLRLAEPTLIACDRSEAAKLDQAGLFRMQRQRERSKRVRIASQKRRASAAFSKPTTMSSA